MDFGLTDDQRDIQRTARDLLAERATFARVREHAEAGTTDTALWKELCELGWPGIAISEANGGQGLGTIELSILCEELGRVVAPVPFLASAMAACVIEQAGSDEQRERWLPGLASGETIGALAGAIDGTSELVISGAEADVFVLVEDDGSGRLVTAQEAEVSKVAAIDPTRSAARVSAADGAGEQLEDGCPGLGRALVAVSSELVGVSERALEMTRRVCEGPQAVRRARRRLRGRLASLRADAAGNRAGALAGGVRRVERGRRPGSLAEAAAMAKAAASQAGREVTAGAIQMHGGIGFTWEADVHWLFKRAQLDAALLGGAGRHRARVAAILADKIAASTAA